jgi:hypothetical protein
MNLISSASDGEDTFSLRVWRLGSPACQTTSFQWPRRQLRVNHHLETMRSEPTDETAGDPCPPGRAVITIVTERKGSRKVGHVLRPIDMLRPPGMSVSRTILE